MIWKLINLRNRNVPYLAQFGFRTAFIRLEKVIVCGQLDFVSVASR